MCPDSIRPTTLREPTRHRSSSNAKSLGEQIRDQSPAALADDWRSTRLLFKIQDATLATTKLSKIIQRPPPTGKPSRSVGGQRPNSTSVNSASGHAIWSRRPLQSELDRKPPPSAATRATKRKQPILLVLGGVKSESTASFRLAPPTTRQRTIDFSPDSIAAHDVNKTPIRGSISCARVVDQPRDEPLRSGSILRSAARIDASRLAPARNARRPAELRLRKRPAAIKADFAGSTNKQAPPISAVLRIVEASPSSLAGRQPPQLEPPGAAWLGH